MHRQKADLTFKAVSVFLGLLGGTLQRDHDVPEAEVALIAVLGVFFNNGAVLVIFVHRKGEDVGRAVDAAVHGVERADALVVGQHDADLHIGAKLHIAKAGFGRCLHQRAQLFGDRELVLLI